MSLTEFHDYIVNLPQEVLMTATGFFVTGVFCAIVSHFTWSFLDSIFSFFKLLFKFLYKKYKKNASKEKEK